MSDSAISIKSKYEMTKLNHFILNKNPSANNLETVLSLLMKNKKIGKRRSSYKTSYTDTISGLNLNYKSKEIKKFDELNDSLSDISEFDLEKDQDDINSEFNSSEENISDIEEEKIFVKSKRKIEPKEDVEYEILLEKQYEDIIENLKLKRK